MKNWKANSLFVAVATALMLSACGGGGDNGAGSGSSGTPSTPTTPPTISGLADASITSGSSTTEQFTVGDAVVAANALTVTVGSDNSALLPASGLVASGTTSARSIVITPANGQSGTGHVTVTVSDGKQSATSTITVTVTAAASNPNALQMSVPAPSYVAGSVQMNMYTELNQARTAYGVGLLADNADLDSTAQHHAQYLNANAASITLNTNLHDEVSTFTGYTGDTPAVRVSASGYGPRAVGEVADIGVGNTVSNIDPGTSMVDLWLSVPYHRLTALAPYRDVGIGSSFANMGSPSALLYGIMDFGTQNVAQAQLPGNGWVGMWPVPNATNVRYGFLGETPNPIPENNGQCAGYPVSIQAPYGAVLAATTFTLTEAATGNPVSVKLLTAATDPNQELQTNTAVIIPYAPLKMNAIYNVAFTGSIGGTAYTNNWSFTTANQDGTALYGCAPSK